MTKYKEHLKIVFILAVCLIPRLLLLNKGPFHYDVVEYLISMRDKVVTFHTASFPLVSFLLVAMARLRDILAPSIPYLSLLLVSTAVIAASASVVIYLTFRKVVDPAAALIYSLLVSFIPPFFSVTTYGRIDHALAILFFPVSIVCFLRRKWVICALATSLVIGSRPEGIIILGIYMAFIFFEAATGKEEAVVKRWRSAAIRFFTILVFSFIPVLVFAMITPNGKNFFTILIKGILKDPAYQNTEGFSGIRLARIHDGGLMLLRIVAIPAFLAIAGFFKKIREKDLWNTVFFSTSFLVYFLFMVNMEAFSPRYLIIPVFFMMFFAGYGIGGIRNPKIVRVVVTFFMILIMTAQVFFIVYERHLNAYQVDFVKYVEEITEPESVVITQDEWVFYNYYTKRKVLVPPIGTSPKEWTVFFEKIISEFMHNHPVYLTTTGLTYDPAFAFRRFIQNSFYLRPVGARINEDWYSKEMDQHLFREQVFMLVPNLLADKLKKEANR